MQKETERRKETECEKQRKRQSDRNTKKYFENEKLDNFFFTSFVESRIGGVLNPSARYTINICHFMPHLEGVC